VDLTEAKALALKAAAHWGVHLEEPFAMSAVSYVAPAGDVVVKVPWGGDDESLHEGDALRAWNGNGAVRLLDQRGTAVLEQRAVPGTDLAEVPEAEATAVAVALAQRLWLPARPPFRPVVPQVHQWLDRVNGPGVERARDLLGRIGEPAGWLVHGDLHHHNIVRHGTGWVAIDPKPYLSEREYDVPAFLWNPYANDLSDRAQTERRIQAFVDVGLDGWRIRAWAYVRGCYLRPHLAARLEDLLDST
jgi:streptomycin 6-kinase